MRYGCYSQGVTIMAFSMHVLPSEAGCGMVSWYRSC